ncbi:MAG: TetR/AcrR family transcriptional regulator [Caulobacteraceae bacterium]
MKLAATSQARRPYRQTARAASSEATKASVLEAFRRRLERDWFEDIRLEDVAQDAGVTVQTVIRLFGGKDGLLTATVDRVAAVIDLNRGPPTDDIPLLVTRIVEDYEQVGDLVMRMLAQEERHPAIRKVTDFGRSEHRASLGRSFAGALSPLTEPEARQRLDALVVATDLYVWKLVRRDMRRPLSELRALMECMIQAALTACPVSPLEADHHHD